MHADMLIVDLCMKMWVDMCMDMGMGMCTDMCIDTLGRRHLPPNEGISELHPKRETEARLGRADRGTAHGTAMPDTEPLGAAVGGGRRINGCDVHWRHEQHVEPSRRRRPKSAARAIEE